MLTLKGCIGRINYILKQKVKKPFSLIPLANMVIYNLLSAKKLSVKDKKTLYRLIDELRGYTQNSGTDSNAYSKEFDENTCDYKIARELVLRFKGHPFDVLSVWINHYYYDSQLWHEAVDQMIGINRVEGLISAIEHAQPSCFETKEDLQQRCWDQLTSHQLSFKDLERLCVLTTIPLRISKLACELVLKNNLLDGLPEKDYYLYVFKNVILKAKDINHYSELIKKHHKKSVQLIGKVAKK